MDIKELKEKILYYLSVYYGECQGAEKRLKEYIAQHTNRSECNKWYDALSYAFDDLINEGNIRVMLYEKMTGNQKYAFDYEGKTFYEIISKDINSK